MYRVYAEDLSLLGGPMGSEPPALPKLFDTFYKSLAHAKEHAENHFGKAIGWNTKPSGSMNSGDLGWVMYHIEPVQTED